MLASACLPFLFQAVEIDGEAYWDGGYMGNPAIFPLIYNCESADVVIVHINPIERQEILPDGRRDPEPLNEISFNSSLMREMRVIEFVTRLIDEGRVTDGSVRRMLIHAIEAEDTMRCLSVSSKLNPDWGFLLTLKQLGRKRADQWLVHHFEALNHRSTCDIRARYL